MLQFVDVIVPLPLAGTFTYALPEHLVNRVQTGCRIIVPLGAKKMYSAIVTRVHQETPADGIVVKEALELLDATPVLLPAQLKLWQWIADYYICNLGEVYKAALPSGMKLESESIVVYNPDFEADAPLGKTEQHIMDMLEQKPEQKVSDLQKNSLVKNILPAVKSLLEKGAVLVKEEVKRTYRPKTVNCVRLSESYFDEDKLNDLFDSMTRSVKQQELLIKYLDLSKASSALKLRNRNLLVEVEKAQLLQACGVTSGVFNALRDRGVIEVYEKNVGRLAHKAFPEQMVLHPLSLAQQRAMDGIKKVWQDRNVCLLHGVTSSGKTEVYIHLILEMIKQGKQVLYLLPEIVLTAQLVERLRRVFGNRLGVYHSKYPDAERVEVWQKQLSDQPYDIIVGVRSSVFLPFQKLGMVIVDEEHENSFKQQDPAPRYHARNVALVLAQMYGAKTLLGTATPSMESYYNAKQGKYGLVELSERYSQVNLPEIQVVNVMELRRRKEMSGPFSPNLLAAMRRALEKKEQIILFQNRRGYAPQMECHVCGWTPRCTNCDVSLTYHKGNNMMTCHYCGSSYAIPVRCPNCESQDLHSIGYGTERIEDSIREVFPDARIARMDLDTTRSRQAYEQIISDFQMGKTDILVGTQMVTKGLDFERVSVVGILNADTMLNMPDFRCYERAFQMMSQVAGRAGRRRAQGLVILQTKNPSTPVIGQVCRNDFPSLYRDEMENRHSFVYPPFVRLVYIYLKHKDGRLIDALARDMLALVHRQFGERVKGPDTPPVGRVQQFHIRKLMLKVELNASMADARARLRNIQQYLLSQPQYKAAQVYYDVDPM